jgi:hypothetical protein
MRDLIDILTLFYFAQSERLRWFPSPIGFDWYFHARQDPYSQDLSYPNFPCPFVAENPRKCDDGSLSGKLLRTPWRIRTSMATVLLT